MMIISFHTISIIPRKKLSKPTHSLRNHSNPKPKCMLLSLQCTQQKKEHQLSYLFSQIPESSCKYTSVGVYASHAAQTSLKAAVSVILTAISASLSTNCI